MWMWSEYPTEMFLSPWKRFKHLFRVSMSLEFSTLYTRNSEWLRHGNVALHWWSSEGDRQGGLGWGVAGTSSFHSVTPQKPGFPCLLGNQKITRASSTSFLLRNFNTSMLIFWSVVRSHFENGCSIIIIKKAVILCWVIYCKIIYKYLAVFSNLNNGPTNSSDKDSSKLKTKSACWILLYLKNKSIQQIKIKQFFFLEIKHITR